MNSRTCRICALWKAWRSRPAWWVVLVICGATSLGFAETPDQVVRLWPGPAPGETTEELGTPLPRRPQETPPATRITGITCPTLEIYQPSSPNGDVLIILPGGGYRYVVTDKEGSEAARRFQRLGITGCVLRYRTSDPDPNAPLPPIRPVQDLHRSLRVVRAQAKDWGITLKRVGVLAFSAGGQVAAAALTHTEPAYAATDVIDQQSWRADFGLLIYPWKLIDPQTGRLRTSIRVDAQTPPMFLVHTHDDSSSSLGSALLYVELKRAEVPAELHIYASGGHGYGSRPVSGSNVHTWTDYAANWLQRTLPSAESHKE